MLLSWGRFVHRHRWPILVLSLLAFVTSLDLVVLGGQLRNVNDFGFEANRGYGLEAQQLRHSTIGFELVIGSPTFRVGDSAFAAEIDRALVDLRRDRRVSVIQLPPLDDPQAQSSQISTDRHYIEANVLVTDDFYTAANYLNELLDEIKPGPLVVYPAGTLPLYTTYETRTRNDLKRGDLSLPLSLLILVLVFGSLTASLLCLGVGFFAVAGGVGAMYLLSRAVDVSVYALDVVAVIGLGVAIDYSLFVTSRYREELSGGASAEAALAVTMATAGKAIAMSGVTVAIGLTGLLFYQGTALSSLGVTGAIVVLISVGYALTLLPALLAILGERAFSLGLPGVLRWRAPRRSGLWHQLALLVMRRPAAVLAPCLAVLLLVGLPFTQMRLDLGDLKLLPPKDAARQGTSLLVSVFGRGAYVDVVIVFHHGSPLAPANVAAAFDVAQRVQRSPGVDHVLSYVTVEQGLDAQGYQALYERSRTGLPAPVADTLAQLTGTRLAVLRAYLLHATTSSDQAKAVVRYLRAHDAIRDADVLVTGPTAFDVDYVDYILGRTPWAIGCIVLATLAALLLLLRSVVLPVKAIAMNALSLTAAFGALVWVFQQGHLSAFLDFTPSAIDPTIPVLVFCVVFGLSMDYEVFLLTRMKEVWQLTGDNRAAVASGLEASGRLVTGAAAIMVTIFVEFGIVSTIVVVKSLTLGMALAIFVDATIVRALLVPALMRVLGSVNWWAPAWMRYRSGRPTGS